MGSLAAAPGALPAQGRWGFLQRLWRNVVADDISIMAASVGFYGVLSLFPGLSTLISLYGLIADPHQAETVIGTWGWLLPSEAQDLVMAQLKSLVAAGTGKLGFGLVVSLLFALWSTNYATATLISALNVAYDEVEQRSYLKVMATSMVLTAGLVLFGMLALLLVAVLPAVIDYLPLPQTWRDTIALVRWPVLAVLVMIALAATYRFAPCCERRRWLGVSWGAALATAAWVAVSYGFSVYVARFATYDKMYGALGAVVVLMMWLYLSAYIVLLGAEFDAEMERRDGSHGHGRRRRACDRPAPTP